MEAYDISWRLEMVKIQRLLSAYTTSLASEFIIRIAAVICFPQVSKSVMDPSLLVWREGRSCHIWRCICPVDVSLSSRICRVKMFPHPFTKRPFGSGIVWGVHTSINVTRTPGDACLCDEDCGNEWCVTSLRSVLVHVLLFPLDSYTELWVGSSANKRMEEVKGESM